MTMINYEAREAREDLAHDTPKREPIEYTAVRLRDCWAVRPAGSLGTCGWIDGEPWTVQYFKRLPYGVRVEE